MTMTLDGTNGVTFNDTSLQGAAASPYVLKNRIINGAMVINQRGVSVTANTSTSGTYITDRFREVVTAGTGVVLTIANGQVEIPYLIGVEASQARAILINSNFLIKEFNDYDPNQAIGVVISQFPEAGATSTIGESVTIAINKAP